MIITAKEIQFSQEILVFVVSPSKIKLLSRAYAHNQCFDGENAERIDKNFGIKGAAESTSIISIRTDFED